MIKFNKCEICNKNFEVKSGCKGVTCSRQCAAIYTGQLKTENYKMSEQNASNEYYKCPKTCSECNIDLPYHKRHNTFCSYSCSATFFNKIRKNKNWVHPLKGTGFLTGVGPNGVKNFIKIYYCNGCGKINQLPVTHDDCCGTQHNISFYSSLNKWFNFNLSNLKTENFINDYNDLKNKLIYEYSLMSLTEMANKYNHPNIRNFYKIFISLGIQVRSVSEGVKHFILNHPDHSMPSSFRFKRGHITHNGKTYYYRSSYEETVFLELFKHNIDFEYENYRCEYYDTVRRAIRIAIPDITYKNILLEIKSEYTYNETNMIAKSHSYVADGYDVYVLVDFILYKLENNKFMLYSSNDYASLFK